MIMEPSNARKDFSFAMASVLTLQRMICIVGYASESAGTRTFSARAKRGIARLRTTAQGRRAGSIRVRKFVRIWNRLATKGRGCCHVDVGVDTFSRLAEMLFHVVTVVSEAKAFLLAIVTCRSIGPKPGAYWEMNPLVL